MVLEIQLEPASEDLKDLEIFSALLCFVPTGI